MHIQSRNFLLTHAYLWNLGNPEWSTAVSSATHSISYVPPEAMPSQMNAFKLPVFPLPDDERLHNELGDKCKVLINVFWLYHIERIVHSQKAFQFTRPLRQ